MVSTCSVCRKTFTTAQDLRRHLDASGHRRGNTGTSRPRNNRPRSNNAIKARVLPPSELAPVNTRRLTMELKPNTSQAKAALGYNLRIGGGTSGTTFTGLAVGDQVRKISIEWESNLVSSEYTARWVAIVGANAPATHDMALARKIAQLGGVGGTAGHLNFEAAVLAGTPYEVQAGIEKFIVIVMEHVGGPTIAVEAGVFRVHLDVLGTPTTNIPLL